MFSIQIHLNEDVLLDTRRLQDVHKVIYLSGNTVLIDL